MAELVLSEAHNGGRFDITVNDTIAITLPESGGGYQWALVSLDESHLTLEGRRYQPAQGGIGSAGSDGWRLVAKKPGRTRIELKKGRSWESEPIGQFTVELEIRDR